MGRKRKPQDVLPRSLVNHGEDFMALFTHGDDQGKRQRPTPASNVPEVQKYSGLEPASESDSEESCSDVDETSDELSDEESEVLSSNDSDSLDCLDALKLNLSSRAPDPNEAKAEEELTSLAEAGEEERDSFMSGKVGKVHRKSHRNKAWMKKKQPAEKDDDEIARELFKKASKEVQMLGAKGMNKGAAKDLKRMEWERLGGKPRKGHRIPKSVGVVMHQNRLAKEKANKRSEEKEGRVLRDSLKVLKQQQTRKKKEHHKRRGGKLRNAVFQGP